MHQPRKIGGPQLSCNNNFARAISAILPKVQSEKQGLLFRDWIPLALAEPEWLDLINVYFESCKTTGEDKEDAEDAENTEKMENSRNTNNTNNTGSTDTQRAENNKEKEHTAPRTRTYQD